MARAGAKPQRTDLLSPKLPVQTMTGQPYGAAKAQADAQKAVPMAPPPGPAAGGPPPGPSGPGPGDLAPLTAPTMRPDEPVTHGLSLGPGGGPEVLPQPPDPVVKGLGFLNALGDRLPIEFKNLKNELAIGQANQMAP